jgi:hypothetical protein
LSKLSVQALEQIVEWYANGVRICGKYHDGNWSPYNREVFYDVLLRWNHYQGQLEEARL